MSDMWTSLSTAPLGIPDLSGARCVGKADLWDETDDPQIVEYTTNQCLSCPALERCREFAAGQKRLTGVVAGAVYRYSPGHDTGGHHIWGAASAAQVVSLTPRVRDLLTNVGT